MGFWPSYSSNVEAYHRLYKRDADCFSDHRPCAENDWPALSELDGLYLEKTNRRLKQYSKETGVGVFEPKVQLCSGEFVSLMEIAERSAVHIKPATRDDICLVHGDTCFSNLLFDSRLESVKCIDPRGMLPSGKISLYGDRRYDLAKLYHSIIGGYDFIVADRFEVLNDSFCPRDLLIYQNDKLVEAACEHFSENILDGMGYSAKEILAIVIQLFFQCCPCTQMRLIGNALSCLMLHVCTKFWRPINDCYSNGWAFKKVHVCWIHYPEIYVRSRRQISFLFCG